MLDEMFTIFDNVTCHDLNPESINIYVVYLINVKRIEQVNNLSYDYVNYR